MTAGGAVCFRPPRGAGFAWHDNDLAEAHVEHEESVGYGYVVVHDGPDDAQPLHETPFERLEQARGFALAWLAERAAAADRLAVVRLHRASGRRDTVAIVDPASADVRSELERKRTGAAPG
jgi:hypothetical protein